MKLLLRCFAAVLPVLSLLALRAVAKPPSDILPVEKRHSTIELAQRLARPPELNPVRPDIVNPFNPAGFEQPDPEEIRAATAAYNKGVGPAPAGGAAPGAGSTARQPGEREILETLAAKLPTTGTMVFNGEPLLLAGRLRLKVGDKFTVASNGQDYELELAAIDRTTFTLRYHGEEITRSIKLGKSP